jgi:hypothetical protein
MVPLTCSEGTKPTPGSRRCWPGRGSKIARWFTFWHRADPSPFCRAQAFLRWLEYEELNQLLLRMIKRKGLYPRAEHGANGITE